MRLFLTISFGLFFVITFATIIFLRSSVFGKVPRTEELQKLAGSKAFNAQEGRFENRRSHLHKEMNDRNFSLSTFIETMKQWKDNSEGVPNQKLPAQSPNLAEFLKSDPEHKIKFIWIGHSTFLLRMAGRTILVDPVFSASVSPVPVLARRFQAPPLKLNELPAIDFILISHDHYDHLDMQSIKYFQSRACKFIVPLGISSHLAHWGISRDRVIERDWWESVEFEGLKFTATPSQHFSGRDLFHSNKTLWASWVIQYREQKVYFSGDSGYDTHFKEIGERFGPFDIAFMETGQYNEKWEEVHMLPEQSAQAYFDLKAKSYVPVHWGMFELSIHAWYEPIERIFQLAQERSINLMTPKLGELISLEQSDDKLSHDRAQQKWWSFALKQNTKDHFASQEISQKIPKETSKL